MISINATLVVQVLNFLVLIWILNRILFRPTFRIIQEREETVEDLKAQGAKIRAEAEAKATEFEAQLRQARREAVASREEVRRGASAQAEEIITRAEGKAQAHVAAVREQAVQEAEKARESLREYKDALVDRVLLKVMGRKVG